MKKGSLVSALCAAVLSVPVLGVAASIPVHNTGVNTSDVLVAPGAQASFWTLSAEPAGAGESIGSNPFRFNCCYFSDTSTAAWVSPQSSGNAGTQGIYTYDLSFDLSGQDPATAVISGTFGTDNDGSISLNSGAPVATTGFAGFVSPTPFTFNSGFVAGVNTIHLAVNNGGDPTAFFVSFTSATVNPVGNVTTVTQAPALSWPMLAVLAALFAAIGSLTAGKMRVRR